MGMVSGKVLKSVVHGGGTLRRGSRVTLPDRTARELAKKGILKLDQDAAGGNPESAAGARSSASPAVQVSTPQTATPSADGATSSPATPDPQPDPKPARSKRKSKKKTAPAAQ